MCIHMWRGGCEANVTPIVINITDTHVTLVGGGGVDSIAVECATNNMHVHILEPDTYMKKVAEYVIVLIKNFFYISTCIFAAICWNRDNSEAPFYFF